MSHANEAAGYAHEAPRRHGDGLGVAGRKGGPKRSLQQMGRAIDVALEPLGHPASQERARHHGQPVGGAQQAESIKEVDAAVGAQHIIPASDEASSHAHHEDTGAARTVPDGPQTRLLCLPVGAGRRGRRALRGPNRQQGTEWAAASCRWPNGCPWAHDLSAATLHGTEYASHPWCSERCRAGRSMAPRQPACPTPASRAVRPANGRPRRPAHFAASTCLIRPSWPRPTHLSCVRMLSPSRNGAPRPADSPAPCIARSGWVGHPPRGWPLSLRTRTSAFVTLSAGAKRYGGGSVVWHGKRPAQP